MILCFLPTGAFGRPVTICNLTGLAVASAAALMVAEAPQEGAGEHRGGSEDDAGEDGYKCIFVHYFNF